MCCLEAEIHNFVVFHFTFKLLRTFERKFQEIHLNSGFPNETKLLILSFWINVGKGANNDLIDLFQVAMPCWWAKQREMQKKKINRIISQKWHAYTYKKKPQNTTAGSLWLSLRSPDNKPGYWHLTDMPASTVWEKRPLGITENAKNDNKQQEKPRNSQ